MSFRGRLRLFFAIIVLVPMIAVAGVLFFLVEESETGKTDAGIAAALLNAFSVYREASDRAEASLRRASADPGLNRALGDGRPAAAQRRLRGLVRADPRVVSMELYGIGDVRLARAGSGAGVAPLGGRLAASDELGSVTLAVSVTTARAYARRLSGLSRNSVQVSVFRGGRRLASTVGGVAGDPERGSPDETREFEIRGREYRGRVERLRQPAGPPLEIVVFQETGELSSSIAENRLVVGGILLLFALIALAASGLVVRALQGQIGQFLDAARRLARGDFKHAVPVEGDDEFAALGREFNSMSSQLEAKIEEVEQKRMELGETIRRVGTAFASGLDRQGVVVLAIETAIDATEAEAGRALPVDPQAFRESRLGPQDDGLTRALEAAERKAFSVTPEVGAELLEPLDTEAPPKQRAVAGASLDGVHALAQPIRARLGSRSYAQYVGVFSIVRRGRSFSPEDAQLLEYLAGQAVVSIENADLHETVQRQAVTDELTGLANVRELHGTLHREIERSKRFGAPLGLVMLDLDDFKQINDQHGHQQGDDVLIAVARVLREMSRDIDEPARYGGEELAVVLPQTDAEGAGQLAERMRVGIERLRIPKLDGSGELRVTASFGVASIPEVASDKSSLIAAADGALYRAKRAGKNRVERADRVPVSR